MALIVCPALLFGVIGNAHVVQPSRDEAACREEAARIVLEIRHGTRATSFDTQTRTHTKESIMSHHVILTTASWQRIVYVSTPCAISHTLLVYAVSY